METRIRSLLVSSSERVYGRDAELSILRSKLDQASGNKRSSNEQQGEGEEENRTVPLVFVGGLSGSGKTSLVDYAYRSSTRSTRDGDNLNRKCLLGCGKFEHHKDPSPYGVLLQALGEITQAMVHSTERQVYADLLSETLSPDEWARLVYLIPDLQFLNDEATSPKTTTTSARDPTRSSDEIDPAGSSTYDYSKDEAEKLKFTIRIFLREVSRADCPVVLWLDDVQWIDALTSDVLSAILLDKELKHLVFVASFRTENNTDSANNGGGSDGASSLSRLDLLVQKLKTSFRGPDCQEIAVGNLTCATVKEILDDLLGKNVNTTDLVELLLERTGGNAFHVLEMLRHLEANRLLWYSSSMCQWTWEVDRVRALTMASGNIAEILRQKIFRLSTAEVELLQLCGCLGYQFRQNILSAAVAAAAVNANSSDDPAVETPSVEDRLDVLLKEGLLERVGSHVKFSHDKILEAALDTFQNDQALATFHFRIGMELFRHYFIENDDPKMQQELLFLCADRLNSGLSFIDEADYGLRLKLCGLNLRAARLAADLSAFELALAYSKKGLGILNEFETCWTEYYNLSLGINTLYARMCLFAGNSHAEDLLTTVEVVLQNAKTFEASLEARFTLLDFYRGTAKYPEMVTSMFETLGELGVKLPVNPSLADAKAEFKKTAARLKALSDSGILNMPINEEYPLCDFCIRVLDRVFHQLNHTHGASMQIVAACRMVEITLQYGIGAYSAAAFGSFTKVCLAELFEIELGTRASQLCLALIEKVGSLPGASIASARNSATCLFTWFKPLSTTVDYVVETYKIGFRIGDQASAFHAMIGYGWSYYYSGLRIGPLVADLANFIQQMYDYGQFTSILATLSLYQCVINLTSSPSKKTSVEGEMRNSLAFIDPIAGEDVFDIGGGASKLWRKRLGWNGNTGGQSDLSYLLQIAIFCRNFPLAVETKEKLLRSDKTNASAVIHGAFYFGLARAFYIGLVAYWQAKKCSRLNVVKRQRYLREAKRYHDMLRKWVVDHGSINLPQKLFILDAEALSITYSDDLACDDAKANIKGAYDKAIVASMKSGFMQDAALAAHLASETIRSDRESYWDRARGLYLRWGATAVVHRLDQQESDYDPSSALSASSSMNCDDFLNEMASEGGFRARARFAGMSEELSASSELFLLDASRRLSQVKELAS